MSWFEKILVSDTLADEPSGNGVRHQYIYLRERPCRLKRIFSPIVLSICLSLLSACGFHLRGEAEFPPGVSTVNIQTDDRYTPFYRELVTKIRTGGLRPVDDPGSADAVIRVLRDETGRRVLTVSARNVPREFEVFYAVNCTVLIHGKKVVDSQRFILVRDYTFDETKVLGKTKEEEMLTDSLARNLVGLLVQTVSASD